MTKHNLPTLPNLHSLIYEAPRLWKSEMSAGLTTATLLIPQSMAYAFLAGLPAYVGLYAAIIPAIIYAFSGSAKTLSVGPVAMDSLLTLATLSAFIQVTGTPEYIHAAILLALTVGLTLILMSILQVGKLVRFLSPAMMGGFTSAAALIIGLSQLKHLMGVKLGRSTAVYEVLLEAGGKIGETSLLTLTIGLASFLIFKILPRIKNGIPAGLIGVITMTIMSAIFSLHTHGLAVVGDIPRGLPSFALPDLKTWGALLTGEHSSTFIGGALSIALLAFMEAIAVGTAVAEDKGYKVKPGMELFSLGAANIVGSLFGGYPVAGGFSRTAVNDRAGARTPLAALITSATVALVVWQLTPVLYFLPQATLAAMIMSAVFGLIDLTLPKRYLKENKVAFIIWTSTCLATLLLGLQIGILTGVGLSFGSHLLTALYLKPSQDDQVEPNHTIPSAQNS